MKRDFKIFSCYLGSLDVIQKRSNRRVDPFKSFLTFYRPLFYHYLEQRFLNFFNWRPHFDWGVIVALCLATPKFSFATYSLRSPDLENEHLNFPSLNIFSPSRPSRVHNLICLQPFSSSFVGKANYIRLELVVIQKHHQLQPNIICI